MAQASAISAFNMHGAPSVSYPVGRSRFGVGLGALLWLAGAVLALAWFAQTAEPGWPQGLMGGVVLLCGALLWRELRRTPSGALAWDGARFSRVLQAAEVPGKVAVVLDLQRLILVRFRAEGVPDEWLWLESRMAPGRWPMLRCALHAAVSGQVAGNAGANASGRALS